MIVDYADRNEASDGPAHFATHLQELCVNREAEGYQLVNVLPGDRIEGVLQGAWLFFAEASSNEMLHTMTVQEALEQPIMDLAASPSTPGL